MRFEGKRVLVTGAASGIGRATALAFVAEGAAVLIADINEAGLQETVAMAGSAGEQLSPRRFDANKRENCFALIDACGDQLGGLDVLCNIAGFAQSRHFADFSESDWQNMLAVNLSAVFYTCQAAMPELLKSGGNIVNMASSAGLVGQAYQASYCATKGAVVMLSKSLALEFAARGVRVNAVCPGGVNTPLAHNFSLPDNVDGKLVERLFPLIDSAEPEEIATAILYLASADARFVTGTAFPIDGGQTAG
ncbi:MAG: SDR family NAD(P)-dependent oxidoreductase [Gammaproteobacteria bacterium]|nr:SDR family NAD(P)-dependent oxidoreductase [Gammaproteobacteria bacterium]